MTNGIQCGVMHIPNITSKMIDSERTLAVEEQDLILQ